MKCVHVVDIATADNVVVLVTNDEDHPQAHSYYANGLDSVKAIARATFAARSDACDFSFGFNYSQFQRHNKPMRHVDRHWPCRVNNF